MDQNIVKLKQCSKCKEVKPTTEFYHLKRLCGNPDSWCKHCKMLSNKAVIAKNPEAKKKYKQEYHLRNREKHLINMKGDNIKRKYKISLQEYIDKLASQDHRCKICNTPISGRTAHLDHSHDSKRLRDFLCDFCNKGLGHFRDSPELLQNAINYLKRHE